MTRSCSAPGCVKRHGDKPRLGDKLSFHSFPLGDKNLLKKWVKATGRHDGGRPWAPSPSSLLCSDHFAMHDFVPCLQYRKLREGSVPTWFKHLEDKNTTDLRPPPRKLIRTGTSWQRTAGQGLLQPPATEGPCGSGARSPPPAEEPCRSDARPSPPAEEPCRSDVRPSPPPAEEPCGPGARTEASPSPPLAEEPWWSCPPAEESWWPGEPEEEPWSEEPEEEPWSEARLSPQPDVDPLALDVTPTMKHGDHKYNMEPERNDIYGPMEKLLERCRKLRYERKLLMQKLARCDRKILCMQTALKALKENS